MKYKYEYLLHRWGGFWNKHNILVHKEPDFEYKWFDTKEEREIEILRLRRLEDLQGQYLLTRNKYNDSTIAMSETEGYLTRYRFIIQAHVLVNNEIKVVENDLGYGFFSNEEFDCLGNCADYMKEWKYGISADLPDDHELLYSTLILR